MTQLQSFHIAFELWAIIFGVIAAICVFATRSHERKAAVTLISMLAVDAVMNTADALLVFFSATAYNNQLILRTLISIVYLCAFLFILFSEQHAEEIIEIRGGEENQKLSTACRIVSGVGMMAVLVSQATGLFYSSDERTGIYGLSVKPIIMLLVLAMLPILLQMVRNRKNLRKSEYAAHLGSCLFVAAGFIAQLMFEDQHFFIVTYAATLIIIVMVYQMEFAKDNIDRERALVRMQVHLYTRQIQPHFIYNSLSAIRSKLPEDSDARESLNHFAGFMRGSVDLLTADSCINASREFATVRDYLYMEQERFGDSLTVVTDLQDEDFELPPFTVQTLVENAIRYGIRENQDGRGTLIIRSYRTADTHVIEVMDDGVGFDSTTLKTEKDEHAHIGLSNIRKRLELMCDGSLSVKSALGEGTQVTVQIPIK